MFKTLRNAWRVPELRKKILYTLLLLVIFRFGSYITAPGVNAVALEALQNTASPFLQTVNVITGGAFSQLSIFAMSISPYITASIVIQLLAVAIPSLERLSKEGEQGKKTLSRYTKYLSVFLAAIEAFGIYLAYRGQLYMLEDGTLVQCFISEGIMVPLMFILSLTAGSTFLMWVGDQISNRGIGNGISLLIFAGIISGLPQAATYLYSLCFTAEGAFTISGLLVALAVLVGAVLLIAGVVWVTEAERRIPVQYAKRVVGRKMYGGQNTHIPMKLSMAGVLPVIFAMSAMQFPAMIIQLVNPNVANSTGFWAGVYKVCVFSSLGTAEGMVIYGLIHSLIYLLLIVAFTYFYTWMVFNPVEVSNNLKKNAGFIPGIRAGKKTEEYLKSVLNNITVFGAIFLGIIAILPILAQFAGLQISFGGTAILIVVGVALESIKQLESQMLVRHYKGFLD
ncbi:MAG: preprotein translocase subunit SecY [Clostridia bacterium]|nr:preprotein translocase subunit SecY [Clostridia bacterium]